MSDEWSALLAILLTALILAGAVLYMYFVLMYIKRGHGILEDVKAYLKAMHTHGAFFRNRKK